jgi:hypothetical protein
MKVTIRSGTLGRNHPDPYGFTVVTITDGVKVAELYTDGLGANRAKFYHDGALMREESWVDGPNAATIRLRADMRAQRFIGMSFSTAEDQAYNTEPA